VLAGPSPYKRSGLQCFNGLSPPGVKWPRRSPTQSVSIALMCATPSRPCSPRCLLPPDCTRLWAPGFQLAVHGFATATCAALIPSSIELCEAKSPSPSQAHKPSPLLPFTRLCRPPVPLSPCLAAVSSPAPAAHASFFYAIGAALNPPSTMRESRSTNAKPSWGFLTGDCRPLPQSAPTTSSSSMSAP
jgi:hypothetical protein